MCIRDSPESAELADHRRTLRPLACGPLWNGEEQAWTHPSSARLRTLVTLTADRMLRVHRRTLAAPASGYDCCVRIGIGRAHHDSTNTWRRFRDSTRLNPFRLHPRIRHS